MKLYKVTMRHPDGYISTVRIYDRDTTGAKSQAAHAHPGWIFVSVVLDDSDEN